MIYCKQMLVSSNNSNNAELPQLRNSLVTLRYNKFLGRQKSILTAFHKLSAVTYSNLFYSQMTSCYFGRLYSN